MSPTKVVPTFHPDPHVEKGVSYWRTVPATVDGVLGGYGNGTLPIVDAQGSRAYLLEMLPRLQAVTPASHAGEQGAASPSSSSSSSSTWIEQRIAARGGSDRAVTRALDCGAGVGRVTRDALSRVIDVVHLIEPVESFLDEAKRSSSTWPALAKPPSKTPLHARKAAHFHLCTLQDFDPARPYTSAAAWGKKNGAKAIDREPTLAPGDEADAAAGPSKGALKAVSKAEPFEYDVVWGQWCLQHLSDKDLVAFLQRAQTCLKKPKAAIPAKEQHAAVLDGAGIIVVKENVLRDSKDGSERVWYDDEDHSITRTPNAYERCFRQAGLEIVDRRLQRGLPEELFPVMMWCLRVPVATSAPAS